MATTITPEELYYGSPVTLTYGGVDVGGTIEPPTIFFDVTKVTPDFQQAAGPVADTAIISDIIVRCELMVNQMTAAKLAWALPGAEEVAGVITWEAGRVPSAAYKDLVLVGEGLDGRTMTVTIENALSADNLSIPFGKGEFGGLQMNFIGHYDAATPREVPVTIEFSAGS